MAGLFQKLQLKPGMKLSVSGAPPEFVKLKQKLLKKAGAAKKDLPSAALYFVKSCKEIDKLAKSAVRKAGQDGMLWIAYPKKTSKKYASDVGRDGSLRAFGKFNFEQVRLIALDADWSAMRLRNVGKIKSMTRNKAICLSTAGKRKVATTKKGRTAKKSVRKTAMKKS
ncbi:unnamed protein product [Symbiodinium microadriaticum]|nr:unnamed protein product [Symbiodinium microadriaticum]